MAAAAEVDTVALQVVAAAAGKEELQCRYSGAAGGSSSSKEDAMAIQVVAVAKKKLQWSCS